MSWTLSWKLNCERDLWYTYFYSVIKMNNLLRINYRSTDCSQVFHMQSNQKYYARCLQSYRLLQMTTFGKCIEKTRTLMIIWYAFCINRSLNNIIIYNLLSSSSAKQFLWYQDICRFTEVVNEKSYFGYNKLQRKNSFELVQYLMRILMRCYNVRCIT